MWYGVSNWIQKSEENWMAWILCEPLNKWVIYFKDSSKTKTKIKVFVCLILFGITLELSQNQFNPNRTYDNFDLLANCLGVLVGIVIASRLHIIKLK